MESGGATELNQLKVPSVQHLEREVEKKERNQAQHTKNLFPNVLFYKTVCFAAVASGG